MDIKVAVPIMIIVTLFFFMLILRRLWVTRNTHSKLDVNVLKRPMPMVLDLRNCDIGVSCEEYTLLIVANPKNMPESIRERMDQHTKSCAYHNSSAFYQSALGIMVDDDSDLKKSAINIIEKYDLGAGAIELKKEDGQILYTT